MRFGLSFRTKFFILLGLGTLLYAFANVQRVAIPGAVFDQLQTRLGVPAPGITALGAAFMYVYAAAQLLVGGIVARYGGSRTIMAGCVIFCTGVILFACSDSLALLYLARGITGLGAGTFYLSLVHEVLRVFRKNTTIAVSFVVVIGYFGAVIASPWKNVFFMGITVLAGSAICGAGLKNGVERVTKILMGGLFVLLLTCYKLCFSSLPLLDPNIQ